MNKWLKIIRVKDLKTGDIIRNPDRIHEREVLTIQPIKKLGKNKLIVNSKLIDTIKQFFMNTFIRQTIDFGLDNI